MASKKKTPPLKRLARRRVGKAESEAIRHRQAQESRAPAPPAAGRPPEPKRPEPGLPTLAWETVHQPGEAGGPTVARAPVPGGWLVRSETAHPCGARTESITFVPMPALRWTSWVQSRRPVG